MNGDWLGSIGSAMWLMLNKLGSGGKK